MKLDVSAFAKTNIFSRLQFSQYKKFLFFLKCNFNHAESFFSRENYAGENYAGFFVNKVCSLM